jgi:hypothetical protein
MADQAIVIPLKTAKNRKANLRVQLIGGVQ